MSTTSAISPVCSAPRHRERGTVMQFLKTQLAPRGKVLTVFNVISVALFLASAVILTIRFIYGLSSVSNLDQYFPWGLWKGFCVVTGVAFAGGAYVTCFMVYVLGMKQYQPIVRITVLNGFLAYVFYAGALLLDLGRPWNVINPVIGNSFGLTSVLFLVAWHFMLYMIAQAIELSPAFAEWLGLRKAHRVLEAVTVGAVIFGIALSCLHQSGLGALYMMAKSKIHPLWYSEFIPLLFLVSSVFAGLSIVILQTGAAQKLFRAEMNATTRRSHPSIVFSLARICSGAIFAYLFLQLIAFVHEHHGQYLTGVWGQWFLAEMLVFTLLPGAMFLVGARREQLGLVRAAAVITVLGILINRLNVSMIAYNWNAAHHYVPSWQEFVVAAAVVCAQIWVFRWLVHRLPVVSDSPAWAHEPHADVAAGHTVEG